jgi:hypothetical protein
MVDTFILLLVWLNNNELLIFTLLKVLSLCWYVSIGEKDENTCMRIELCLSAQDDDRLSDCYYYMLYISVDSLPSILSSKTMSILTICMGLDSR